MTASKMKHKKYIYTELGLLILLGISQYFGVTSTNLGVVFAIFCLFFLFPKALDAEALFIAMPFFNMFSYRLGTTSLFYLLIILYSVRYLQRRSFRIKKGKVGIFVLCCLFTITIQNMEIWLKWAIRFWLMVLLFNDEEFDQSLDDTIRYTSVSAILSSGIAYLMQINGKSIYTRSYLYLQDRGSTTRFAGLIGDSVFYGQFIAVLIAANLILAYRDRKYGIFAYIASIIMAGFALLSFSKTMIILITVEVTVYVLLLIVKNSKSRKTIIKNIGIILIVWILIMLLYRYVLSHTNNLLVKGFLTRFSADDLWTGRKSIASYYLELLVADWKCWLSGMKYSQYTMGFQYSNTLFTRAHNIYLETACLFGIIPGIVILLTIICYFLRQQTRYHASVIAYLPMLCLAASGVTLHGHFEWHYYFLCSIAFACVHSDIRKKKGVAFP